MKFSIITCVYNREDTIGAAVDSVASQTYRPLEHLIIDGGSTDRTLAVIGARSHGEMHILSEPDDGIYHAINKGIGLATGDLVGLIHSDDFLAHEMVLAMVADAFADSEVDAVYGDLDYVAATNPSRIVRRWRAGPYLPHKLRWGWMPPHPTLFVRRSVFQAYGPYDTTYRIASDYDAILRWFSQRGWRANYLPEVLVKMRLGGESNRSLERILLKSWEDYRALRANKVGGLATLAAKNLVKLPQFVLR